jgi:hypothetical protein
MKKNCIEISRNELKKSLPDVACNSAENNFFVFWGAAPGDESQTADYFLSGQKISGSGEVLGEPVAVLKTEDMVLLPRVVYNPNKNQYLVIFCLGESYFNIQGVILDADGKAVGEHFKVTDVPANQMHYTMAFNSKRNQFFVTYNDSGSERRICHQRCGGASDKPRSLLQPEG